MANQLDQFVVSFAADSGDLEDAFEHLSDLSDGFASSLTRGFEDIVLHGKSVGDVIDDIALSLAELSLEAALKPLQDTLSSAFAGLAPSLGGLFGTSAPAFAFASGGVVPSPGVAALAGGGIGVLGEAGPEAVLPLARGSDGRLGVRAGGGAPAVSVTFNVHTPDAASFRRSEAQVTTMLARAVERGRRGL